MINISNNGSYKNLHILRNNDSKIISKLSKEIIKNKIMEYIYTKSEYLDLANTELDLLPDNIFNLSMFPNHLYKLSLNENALRDIPESIGKLSALNDLYLSQNKLISLPESIGDLSALNDLSLSENRLISLPKSIGKLSALNDLHLSKNRLSSLPKSIGKLSALNNLNLSGNRLNSLPKSIGKLSALSTLYLFHNRLNSLPKSIGKLSALNDLNLSGNRLNSLPKSIGKLSALRELNFACNHLTTLPDSIGNLSELNYLYLSGNQLTSLPECIGNLQQLRILDLSHNPNLSSLPRKIFNLPSNCRVNINGCNFSQAALDRLREYINRPDYRGPRISYSTTTPNQNINMLTIEESLQRLYNIINKSPSELLNLNRTETLRIWLHKLCYTADYKQLQKEFITKVISYLEKANADEKFRNIFFTTIDDAVETCGDRVTLSVLLLGINYQLETIDLNNMKKLDHLLTRGVWALELLHQIAREKVKDLLFKDLLFIDEIEVYLGYSIKLKKELDLPIDVTNMLFFNCSSLLSSDLEMAKNIVLASINDKEERLDFLISQDRWMKSLEHNYAEEYLSIKHRRDNDLASSDDFTCIRINNTYITELKALTMKILDWK